MNVPANYLSSNKLHCLTWLPLRSGLGKGFNKELLLPGFEAGSTGPGLNLPTAWQVRSPERRVGCKAVGRCPRAVTHRLDLATPPRHGPLTAEQCLSATCCADQLPGPPSHRQKGTISIPRGCSPSFH